MKSGMTPEQWKATADLCGMTVKDFRKWLADKVRQERKNNRKRNVIPARFRFEIAC
jgi:hypothetical protein